MFGSLNGAAGCYRSRCSKVFACNRLHCVSCVIVPVNVRFDCPKDADVVFVDVCAGMIPF